MFRRRACGRAAARTRHGVPAQHRAAAVRVAPLGAAQGIVRPPARRRTQDPPSRVLRRGDRAAQPPPPSRRRRRDAGERREGRRAAAARPRPVQGINDVHGHEAGDAVLVSTAEKIRNCCTADDCCVRLGGDEFAILLRGARARGKRPRQLAEKLLEELGRPIQLGETIVTVGASIGIARLQGASRELRWLLRRADLAMYEAKNSRQEPLRRVRRGDGGRTRQAGRARGRDPPRDRGRRVRSLFPADRRARDGRGEGLRGARALGASGARACSSRRRSSRWPRPAG